MTDEYGNDSGSKEFERVAHELRTRMANGRYPMHSMLPTQRELAEKFRVSRDTVQRALGVLKSEGLIESRQGRGSRVVKTPLINSPTSIVGHDPSVRLRSLINRAFEQPKVALDVFVLSPESLDTHIQAQAERILDRRITPQRITVRLLLADESTIFPRGKAYDPAHDELLIEQALKSRRIHIKSLHTVLADLNTPGLVPSVDFMIRRTSLTPAFKLYLANRAEVLFGPYQVIERRTVLDDELGIEATDFFDLSAELTQHHTKGADTSSGGTFVDTWQAWFDSAWDVLPA
ncbi:GntR family transcriptional regulator [Streptomyces sp. A30]|uniref:GntR family transcriptional regulator n=1 Tax=Streptomyces sp. A30 TaxID=2789273 RepID=UPI00397FE4B3